MLFPRDLSIEIDSTTRSGPTWFNHVLEGFIEHAFETDACRRFLNGLIEQNPQLAPIYVPGNFDRDAPLVTNEALYPKLDGWQLRFRRGETHAAFKLGLDTALLQPLASVLQLGFHGSQGDRAELIDAIAQLGDDVVALVNKGPASLPTLWPRMAGPGILRCEHASLLIQSQTTGILVDPVALQLGFPRMADAPLHAVDALPHALLITHSHDDHFHIPSLLASSADTTQVICPEVPSTSVMCRVDLAGAARDFGLNATALPWGEAKEVGDIRITALPFYGEQPTRDAPGPAPNLRSWGSCYRVDTPEFSVLILVDSGTDPSGCMEDAIADNRARHGAADIAISCLRLFESPFFGGLPHYWATLPFPRLRELWGQRARGSLPSTTAGPDGVAAACHAGEIRYFLPYAHGFVGVGRAIDDIGWGLGEDSERSVCERLRNALDRRGAATQVVDWEVGDAAAVSSSGVHVTRVVGGRPTPRG